MSSISWGYWSSFLSSVTFCCLLLEGLQQVGGSVNVVSNPQDCSSKTAAEAEVACHPSGGCGGAWVLWQANLPCTLCGLSTQLHMYKADCYSSLEVMGWLLYTCAVWILRENALGWKAAHNDQILLKCQVALGTEELSPCGAPMKFKVKKLWFAEWVAELVLSLCLRVLSSPPSDDKNQKPSYDATLILLIRDKRNGVISLPVNKGVTDTAQSCFGYHILCHNIPWSAVAVCSL